MSPPTSSPTPPSTSADPPLGSGQSVPTAFGNIALVMATPTDDSEVFDDLLADVEAYLQRCSVLTEFAEGQVQERIRLMRAVEQLAADREGHLQTIQELEQRLQSLEGSLIVRVARAPHNVWRRVRRSTS